VRFPFTTLSEAELGLQHQVREFLAEHLPSGSFNAGMGMSSGRDQSFSRRLAEHGWLGMALPRAYGGGERGLVDRFVVVEELLRWGAPVGFHWTADRQSGPTINRFGTDEQRERFLPAICRGELSFAIGMSEPDSGSDLSSLRTAATRVEGGWKLNGRKVWTSGAYVCDWLIVLARTSREERQQAGLTQFLVDRRGPGMTVRPITFIDGTSDFCEVVLDDVFVPDSLVLGSIGNGWAQNTAELAFERGGPDRILSSFGVVHGWLNSGVGVPDPVAQEWLGATVARFWVLRSLSLSVARMADAGRSPVTEAALVKEMATRFEQDITAAVTDHYGRPIGLDGETGLDRTLAKATLTGPSWTIRGGTTEILRGVVSRALASPVSDVDAPDGVDPLLWSTADKIFADTCTPSALAAAESSGWAPAAWSKVAEAGLPWLSVPESAGGAGGTLADALAVLHLAGRRAVPLPLAESGLIGGWLLSQAGLRVPEGPLAVVPGDPRDTLMLDDTPRVSAEAKAAIDAAIADLGYVNRGPRPRLTGTAHGVAWAGSASHLVALVGSSLVLCPSGSWSVHRASNLAGEPRDRVVFDGASVAVVPIAVTTTQLRQRGALSRIALIAGALAAVSDLTRTYTAQREQFGRPINRFQAVQAHLVNLAQQVVLAQMACDLAARAVEAGDARFEIPAASVIAAAAAAEGARAAHQAHGAMGMTREYPLQWLTRRLWSWRGEYLSTRDDARFLGALVTRAGADRLYPIITGGSSVVEW
jgi:alkylation response protein AidB-like acyl-CoA dehydrogenase